MIAHTATKFAFGWTGRAAVAVTCAAAGVGRERPEPRIAASDILQVDGNGLPLEAEAKPSDETVVHLAVVRERGAGAVLHTHSVWNTLLSEAAGDAGGLAISGYEMLKALYGVTKSLAGAKNLAEIVELQSAFIRHQFDVFANQASEIRALTTKIAADTAEPIKAQVTRSFETIRKS